jgi:uncharacterized membrane protein YhhN
VQAGRLADLFSGLSILAAAVYGFALMTKPVSGPRMLIKAGAVASIAAVSFVLGGPWLLTLPLLVSAAADAFMAGEPRRWLPFGLTAFLLAHLLYVALFAHNNLRLSVLVEFPRWALVLGAVVAAVTVLRALWGGLRRMREAVVIYAAVVVMMVAIAFSLPWTRSAAMIGAVLFMISDAILAFRLFRGGGPNINADLAVWWFYWAAQALIARAFLHSEA